MTRVVIALGLLLLLGVAASITVEHGVRGLPVSRTAVSGTSSVRTRTIAPTGFARVPGVAGRPPITVSPNTVSPITVSPINWSRSSIGPARVASVTAAASRHRVSPATTAPIPPLAVAIAPPAVSVAAAAEQEADRLFAMPVDERSVVRMAPFRLAVARASVVIISVPVPDALRHDSAGGTAVAFRVTAGSAARVVGRWRGLVAPGGTVATATMSVRRAAGAGHASGAVVEFRDNTGRAFLVPVDLDIAAERAVSLSLDDDYIAASRGMWTGVGFVIQNAGNGAETLAMRIEMPHGWRSATDGLPLHGTVAAGATVRGLLRVWIPPHFAAGQARVRVVLRSGPSIVSSRELFVSVDDLRGQLRPGPVGEVSMAVASGPDGSHATGYAVTIDGAITDSVRLSARAMFTDAGVGVASYGLARAGVATGPPSLTIRSPRLGLMAGAIGVQRSELSGYFVAGLGAQSDVKLGALSVEAFASRPFGFAQQSTFSTGDGSQAGVSLAHRGGALGDVSLHGVAMRDAIGARELKAVTLSSRIAQVAGGELTTEAGYRVHADGAGLGAAVGFHRAVGGSLLELRAVRAPGGSRAYARAADDMSAMLSQRIGHSTLLSAGAWQQRDRNAGLGDFDAQGWFVAPSVEISPIASRVGLEARGSRFAAASPLGRFASDEQQLSAVIDSRWRAAYLSVRSGMARLGRDIDFAGTSLPTASGTRVDLRSAIGVSSSNGQIEALYVSQQFRGTAKLYPQQQSIGARVNSLRLPGLTPMGMMVNADAQRLVTGSNTAANWSARGGVTAALPARLGNASVQAEYNPYLLSTVDGRAGLLYTLRLSRDFALPRVTSPRRQRVFIDENGNGARDHDERGARGVSLRCGTIIVVTDDEGRFGCPAGARAAVDSRTLPTSMLAPAAGLARSNTDDDIALRPLSVRQVRLVVAPDDSMQIRGTALDAMLVIAHDSAGTTWVARSLGGGLFTFEALPPGRYTLALDAGNVAEPVHTGSALPVLQVRSTSVAPVLVIELRGRIVRVKQLGSRSAPGRDVPARGPSAASGTAAVLQEPHNRQHQ